MSGNKSWMIAALLAAGLAAASPAVDGQAGQQNPQSKPPQSQPQQPADPSKSGSSLAMPGAAPNAEELAAVKAFQEMPNTDVPKKIAAGEEFLKKYPDSQYRPMVYSALTLEYIQSGNTEKAFEVGDKEVTLKPDDVQTLAVLGQTIPRAMSANTPEPEKRLAKAEDYSKRAIEVTPTIAKPEGMADQNFVAAKNSTLAMAHSGLGLVYFRRGKFNEAIPELEQSVKIDPNPTPDPVNLYLLGLANQKASRFDDAAVAFNKCAAVNSKLQATCRSGADESKKQASTQLSAPK
ncbi:MAG TPA: tetratricopeptide repeat protein [Candidatus Eisenbacteria bacterium]|jgi:tetratricopeptide (TPR) repeat protein|nr:tetratricopeptide repeat protein [Candidatus Eisenbacteria bacterium]